MKLPVLTTTIACVLLCLSSCNQEDPAEKPETMSSAEYFKANVSFTDARVRSLNQTEYVREVVLTDFSGDQEMPKSIIFDGTTLFDDGSYNDLKAGDGIYTSAAKLGHSDRVPYMDNIEVRSVMRKSIVDFDFLHESNFNNYVTSYSRPGIPTVEGKPSAKLSIKCKVEFGTCGCRADNYGWCDCCCITVSDCEVEASIGF